MSQVAVRDDLAGQESDEGVGGASRHGTTASPSKDHAMCGTREAMSEAAGVALQKA